MGRDRNLAPGDKNRGIKWDDKRVCKYFLCGICPHELFTNTKSDLGPCDKIHDDELRDQFNKAPAYQRSYTEEEFERMMENHIRDCDKRIARGHSRLKLSREQQEPTVTVENEKVKMLTEKINELMDRAERLGCQGNVEEAQGMTRLCEQLKIERQHVVSEVSGLAPIVAASLKDEKLMEVCEICGVFLIIGDAQSRIDDHLNGKQHIGYARLRTCLAERREARVKAREERDKAKAEADAEREAERLKKREEREKSSKETSTRRGERSDKDRDRDKRRSRSRERGKSSTADRGKRSRSPPADGGGGGGGSRSTSERKRSRSRDRNRRDRSRRSRSRERKRGSRSRSRERKRSSRDRKQQRGSRSRSRDRKRDRSRSRDGKRKSPSGGDAERDQQKESKEAAAKTSTSATDEPSASENKTAANNGSSLTN